MVLNLNNLKEYDEVKISVLVKKGTKINFEKGNMMMLAKSAITGIEYGVMSAEYLGEGRWMQDKRVQLKKSSTNEEGDTHDNNE